MFRISIFLFIGILCFSVQPIYAQRDSDVKGVHIEWYGYGDPPVNVNYTERVVTITLSRDGDTVSVYSPATDIDYTFIIKTPNGRVVAERPHPDGFEGTFSFSRIKNDDILKAQIVHGKAYFVSVTGEKGDLKSEQIVDIIIPKQGTASIQDAEEGFKHKQPKSEDNGESEEPAQPKKEIIIPTPPEDDGRANVEANAKVDTEVRKEAPQVAEVDPDRQPEGPAVKTPQEAAEETPLNEEELSEITKVRKQDSIRRAEKIDRIEPADKPLYVYKREEAPGISTPVGYQVDYARANWAAFWGGYRHSQIDGTVAFDGVQDGTNIEIDDTLADEDEEDSFIGGVDFYVGGLHIGFDYSRAQFSETGALVEDEIVQDVLIVAGTGVDTDYIFQWYRGTIGYTVFLNKYFGVGIDAYLEYVRLRFDLDFGNGQQQEDRFEEYIPGLGAHVTFMPTGFWMMSLAAHGGYMHDNEELWLVNVTATTRIYLGEGLFLFGRAEYQIDDYKLGEDNNDFDIDLQSFTVSGGFGFRF